MTEEAGHAPGLAALRRRALEPVDVASLAAFRFMFGALMFAGTLRFMLNGWVERFYVRPTFTFSYWGFEWVELLSPLWMHAAFVLMAVSAAAVAVGLFYRVAIVAFFLVFTYVELIDVTNYLNHYVLVSYLSLLMCFLPLHRAWSVDAWRDPSLRIKSAPAWVVWLLRFQVAVVYVYAGLAKTGSDWLLHAQPLNIWMTARVDTPVIGPLLDVWAVALLMSWGGFLYDTTIVGFLLWERTRALAYVAVIGFHTLTGLLFNIGMFPVIMITVTPIFFAPGWPRRLLPPRWIERLDGDAARAWRPPRRGRALLAAAVAVYVALQVLVPARWLLYPGDVLWHEQGMRWAWKVMLREKNGSVTYRVRLPGATRERYVPPSRYLTRHQEREMSGQPDLILQLGQHIGAELGGEGVEVRVDALVSLNGRAPKRLIDPTVDLMTVRDGVSPADWITEAPDTPPIRLSRGHP